MSRGSRYSFLISRKRAMVSPALTTSPSCAYHCAICPAIADCISLARCPGCNMVTVPLAWIFCVHGRKRMTRLNTPAMIKLRLTLGPMKGLPKSPKLR